MRARSFNRWWLSTVLGLGLLQVLLAVIADPYCVYGIVRYPKRNFEPNTRYLKIEQLKRHPEFDAFILGSSRAGYYDARAAERQCGGSRSRYYNLNASLENGAGIRRKLEWLLSTRPVRQVIVNVDFDLQNVGNDPYDLLRQDHPDVSQVPYTAFYAKYLLFQPRILYRYVAANRQPPKGEPWNDGNGAVAETLYAARPPFDVTRLLDVTLGALAHDVAAGRRRDTASDSGIVEFRRTVELLNRAGTHRVLIVPPYRLDQFAGFHPDAVAVWVRDVVAAGGDIWDFAGYNAVTVDPDRYVDAIHFDHAVGERILRRACGADDDPDDAFGVRVTVANVEAHIASLRRQHAAAGAAAARVKW